MQVSDFERILKSGEEVTYIQESPPVRGTSLQRLLPPGVQTLLVCPIREAEGQRHLVVWSRTVRALSQRDRQWVVAIGRKLSEFVR